MKNDVVEIFLAVLTAGVGLTWIALVINNPNSTATVLTSGAGAFRTTFGTFLQGGKG
jgi:hypothetical protein